MRPRNYLFYEYSESGSIPHSEYILYEEIVLNMLRRNTRFKEIHFWSSFVISITGSWEVSVQYTFLEDIVYLSDCMEDMVSRKELEQIVKIMLSLYNTYCAW